MCPPVFFNVSYAINPWMDPTTPVHRERALAQWSTLVEAYRAHGHRVDLLEPVAGLPDLVFAANGATVVDGRVLPARFATAERAAEAGVHAAWHRRHGVTYGGQGMPSPIAVNEAEGDFAVTSDRILAGYGFRTRLEAHGELAALTGREVVSLELVDPLFYHLDVALTVLDDSADTIAYYPHAFSGGSQDRLRHLYPDAIIATEADAYALGLNCVSDGLHVFIPAHADELRDNIEAAGFRTVEIDLSELRRGGGSVKCCTQEIRPVTKRVHARVGRPTTGGQA